VRWALKSILSWDNDEVPLNVVQIHGTNDRVIPMPSEVHFKIADAGHMMVYNRADEVSEILNKVLHDEV
jgi:carboxypeptidase C (cathepsin A)